MSTIIGAVDGGGNAEDSVGHWKASPKPRAVLDVIDEKTGVVERADDVFNHA